jgi:hypothetical protein
LVHEFEAAGNRTKENVPIRAQSTVIAAATQFSAHFQHEVQAGLSMTTGRLFLISMTSSGQIMAQTPVLSHRSVSMAIVIGVLRGSACTQPRVLMEPIQAAV